MWPGHFVTLHVIGKPNLNLAQLFTFTSPVYQLLTYSEMQLASIVNHKE